MANLQHTVSFRKHSCDIHGGFLLVLVAILINSCTTFPQEGSDIPQSVQPRGTEQIVNALEIWEDFRRDEKRELLNESMAMEPSALALHFLAQEYMKEQRYQEAFDRYSQAIELDPGFARGFFERGIISLWKIQNRSWEEAINDLRMAFQLNPRNINYAMTLADQVKWNKDTQAEALEIYNILVNESPDDPRVFVEYTRFLISQDNRSEALRQINRAIQLTWNSENMYERGSLVLPLYQLGLVEEAEQYIRSLEVSGIKDYWLFANLGTELTKNGFFSQATRMYGKILEHGLVLEHDHGFYYGITAFLSTGSVNPLLVYRNQGNNTIYIAVSNYLTSNQQNNAVREAAYNQMVQAIEKEWGPVRDKRNHVPWLDALLTWRETQN